ncbi:DUF3348 domain-containing protein [Dechloromonas sp. ZY10]|uniref:DUF3348 domain-containing protein n=1 Tax=Dechloromonas aquae TaxID=2664436 RepID=UPI003527FF9D
MTRGLQRATFNRADLVRILSETVSNPIDFKYDFGERLGQWLDFTDALNLSSVLNGRTGATTCALAHPAATELQAQLARARKQLSKAITHDGVFGNDSGRHRFPTPLPEASAESAADFSPYHRYYLAQQRELAATLGALRNQARKALASGNAGQQQLAELDAAFEKSLQARERNLLANIPILLAKRFAQRYQEHRARLVDGSDNPATWSAAGSWLHAFCQDTRAVLLAELDLRLKPITGLIAALGPGEANPNPAP